ncbi:MAG TPA: hypothetical protein VH054_04760 [Polyangiaceae bacterium]|nr:hypothetical protein [Polyangiaceae bacterium]
MKEQKRRLAWQETKVPGGSNVVFDGAPPSVLRVWGGLSALFTAALFVYFTYFPSHPKPVTREAFFRFAPAVLALAGVALMVSEWPGIAAGKLALDRKHIHLVPAAGWRLERRFPIAGIDYVSCDTEDEERGGKGRFRVRAHMKNGERATLAMFGAADDALFMSQRMEALLERARDLRTTG